MSETVVTSLSKDAGIPQAAFTKSKPVLSESFKNNSITHFTKTEWQPIIRRSKSSRMMHNLQRLWFHPLSRETDNHFPPGLAAFAGGLYHSLGFGVEMRFIARLPRTVKESLWTQRIWLSANTWNFHHRGLSVKRGVERAGAWVADTVGPEANAPGKLRVCLSASLPRSPPEMPKQGPLTTERRGP